MEKIGIITLNGYYNYGNRLQNYALQEVLKSYDFEVETIWIESPKNNKRKSTFKKLKKVLVNPTLVFKKIYNKLFINDKKEKRKQRFKIFSEQYINETNYKITKENLPVKLLNDYAYFVTGSDQVWNPYYIKGSSLYFLSFAPKEKSIAYSPSFGISEIPQQHIDNYKEWLKEIAHISVREQDGANIVKELINRDVEVLVDPTLLLRREEWLSIAKPVVNKPNKDILLTYFLGEVPKNAQKMINKYKKKHNLIVVNLANPKHKKFYLTDPAEFLDYINSAKVFFTDSFHGAVFSILFETPFVVTDRKSKTPSMNSRIVTLLSKFNLESRHINNINKKELFNVDYSHTHKILNEERDRSFNYLERSLTKGK